ncbi:MAG TPA: energy-coupling factor transporter ATPase [Anaerolineae bacterium]
MKQITFSHLSYFYPPTAGADEVPALQNVSFEIEAGAFVLVIGASGSGKSTLLRCLNGLVPHFSGGHLSGMLEVDGLNPVAAGPSQMALHVGMVFQDPEAQFVLDRVEDEIAFALENAAVPRQEMHRRVNETLKRMGIEHLRARQISTLSGGEQQRVAICAALVLQPTILVLDEPTSQLDPEAANEVMDILARLNHESGLTIVLAEHRIERVLGWVSQVLLVESGLVTSGAPAEVLRQTELVPPVIVLGRHLGLAPLPLTVAQARDRISEQGLIPQPVPNLAVERDTKTRLLALNDVSAKYGDTAVVKHVSLQVCAGEIVALMGSNGAGKSTLLKTIVGLVKPCAGDITVNAESVIGRDTADICRDVAYLPQNPNALLFADTVSQELAITLANHGMTGAKDPRALLVRLGLERYAESYPRDLSVGERERVAIGAVTVTEPHLVLLDEPTRGLDYAAKRSLAEILRAWKQLGAGILLVTHDVEYAAECADRVVLLAQGSITAEGSPHIVLSGSAIFEPQISQIFPGTGWLTPGDVKVKSANG